MQNSSKIVVRVLSAIMALALVFGLVAMAIQAMGAEDQAGLQQALENGETFYQLTADEDGVVIEKDMMLDLNGHNVTNATVAEGVTLQLMDSATDDYAGAYGSFAGSINGTVQQVVKQDTKNYLVVEKNGVYSAHRFFAGIDRISLAPANAALGYKAIFRGDEVVKENVTNYGYCLWVNDYAQRTFVKNGVFGDEPMTLRIKNILKQGDDAMCQLGAAAQIHANAIITFAGMAPIYGAQHTTTVREAVEAVNSALGADRSSYTQAQIDAVKEMYSKFESYMNGWQIDHILAVEKFTAIAVENKAYGNTVTLGELFAAVAGASIGNVEISVSGVAYEVIAADTWEQTAIVLKGVGEATITVTDNDHCVAASNTLTVVKADPEVEMLPSFTGTYGQTLAEFELPAGYAWVDPSQSVGNAGAMNEFAVIYTPADPNYNAVEIMVGIVVEKANPAYTVPENLTAVYGQRLEEIQLPQGFRWQNTMDEVGHAGENHHYVTYVPEDGNNYNEITNIEVYVTVSKADPIVPEIGELMASYGDDISSIYLMDYQFTWESTGPVGDVGEHTYYVTYTPMDTSNYNIVEHIPVTVRVDPAIPPVPEVIIQAFCGQTLSELDLPEGFRWDDPSVVLTKEGVQYPNVWYSANNPNYIDEVLTYVTVEVSAKPVVIIDKFAVKLYEGEPAFLYRVGNANPVKLSSLFKALDNVEIGTVSIAVEVLAGNVTHTYTSNSTWTAGTIQFSGTGVVKVTITDVAETTAGNPVSITLEVVKAKNITKAESATANSVVLLNDISGTFVVSGGNTFYGNGFTVKLPTTSVKNVGNGFTGYISLGGADDSGAGNGGHLDNVRIEGPVYPEMYIYRDQAKITDSSDPDYGDGLNMRYFVNSVIVYGGNVTISNCYISGSRTALCLRAGNNVVVENTTLEGGAYANMQICAGSSVTLRNLTTVQVDKTDSYGKGKVAHGMGIAVDSDVVDIYIEGYLNQYNWLNQTKWNSIVPSSYQSTFPKFFTDSSFSKYWHYLDGETAPYVNMGFIFACNWDKTKIHDSRDAVDYGTTDATIAGVAGGVYSKLNTVNGNAITNEDLTGPVYAPTGYNPVAPVLNFDNTVNHDADDTNDTNDTYCVYTESTGTLKIGVSGDSKTLDLSNVAVTKNGAALDYTVYLNGKQISGNSVSIKAADGAKQTLVIKANSNDAGFDRDGNPIAGSIEYSWTINVEIAVLAYPAPEWNMGGDYQFDTTNCVYAYHGTSNGYGEAVPIYEGIKINYYNKNGQLVNLDLSGTTTHPTGSANSNSNAFTYTLADGSTLSMKFSSGWKSGATTHQFTTYSNKVYIYPQALDNNNYIRAKVDNQDFDVKISYTFTDPNGQSITQTMRWYNAQASNSKVKTVQWKKFDSTNGKEPSVCVTGDTLVTLADGTQKQIKDVTNSDLLMVWDFYKGEYAVVPAAIVFDHGYDNNTVIKLCFSDGTIVNVINLHQFMDATENKFVTIDAKTVAQYVGHQFAKQDGDSYKTVELVGYEISEQYIEAYGIISAVHYNILVNGMFSTDFMYADYDLFNYFAIGEDMKFDQAAMAEDIANYGLYTYADFAEVLTYEQFVAFNVQYFKIAVGKGVYTYEGILNLIATYLAK